MSDLIPEEILVAVRAALAESARLHAPKTERILAETPSSKTSLTSAEKGVGNGPGLKRLNRGSKN
jgi:hypothetical protein